MESFVLQVQNREYRICLPTSYASQAEKQLGFSILAALDRADSVYTQGVLLWAGLQKLNHGVTLDKTFAIMDDMQDGFTMDGVEFSDFSIESRTKLCMKILTVGGFFTEDTRREIDSKVAESQSNPSDS